MTNPVPGETAATAENASKIKVRRADWPAPDRKPTCRRTIMTVLSKILTSALFGIGIVQRIGRMG